MLLRPLVWFRADFEFEKKCNCPIRSQFVCQFASCAPRSLPKRAPSKQMSVTDSLCVSCTSLEAEAEADEDEDAEARPKRRRVWQKTKRATEGEIGGIG